MAAVGGAVNQKRKRKQTVAGSSGCFRGCYLLSPVKQSVRTYIGYTVNPLRRLRQHNGIIKVKNDAWGAPAVFVSQSSPILSDFLLLDVLICSLLIIATISIDLAQSSHHTHTHTHTSSLLADLARALIHTIDSQIGWCSQDSSGSTMADGTGCVRVSQQYHGIAVRVGVAKSTAIDPFATRCRAARQKVPRAYDVHASS